VKPFASAGAAIRRLHPLCIWDTIKHGGASKAELAAALPRHAQAELQAILDALQQNYCRALGLVRFALSQRDLAGPAGSESSETTDAEQVQDQLLAMLEGAGLEELMAKLSFEERSLMTVGQPAGEWRNLTK
jgi:hypothetical protein